MDRLSAVLKEVRRTNPQMTMYKLLEELQKSRYTALCLALVCGNEKSERVSA